MKNRLLQLLNTLIHILLDNILMNTDKLIKVWISLSSGGRPINY